MTRKSMGIEAERALRRILEGAGLVCIRAAASHGPCDIVALGEADVALIEVKATTDGVFRVSKTRGLREQIGTLKAIADRTEVLAVVAIYFARLDEFRFYSPEAVLDGPVRPQDADLYCDGALTPLSPSPSVGSPAPCVAPGPPLDPAVRERLREIRRAAETV